MDIIYRQVLGNVPDAKIKVELLHRLTNIRIEKSGIFWDITQSNPARDISPPSAESES
jgi:hypothetical protein